MRKSTIFLLILVAFLFVSLLFSLYLNFNKSPAASIPTPTPNIVPTETTNETVNWKTYTNKIYNISFQYPSIFSVSDELPKTKTQGGPKTALELTDSKNNYQISIIINPAGFGPIFADKKITLDYSPTEGLFSTKVVPSTEEDNQYLSLDKKVLWYQFDNDLLSNLTILTFAAKSDTKLETLTTQILSTFKFTDQKEEAALDVAKKYLDAYVSQDWITAKQLNKDPEFDERIAQSYGFTKYTITGHKIDANPNYYHVYITFTDKDGKTHSQAPNSSGPLEVYLTKTKTGEWKALTWYFYP